MLTRKTILLTSSILCLGILPYAHAQQTDSSADAHDRNTQTIQNDIEQGWEETKETASEAAAAAEDMVAGAVITIQEAMVDRDSALSEAQAVTYHPAQTADGMLGETIYNSSEDMIGNVEDLLVDETGKVTHVVVGDGSSLSAGDKKVVFDFDRIARNTTASGVVVPATEETIDEKATYDPASHKGISLKKVLDGTVVNQNRNALASIENIVIADGYATHVVAGFGGVLGIGEEQAALSFDAGELDQQDQQTDIVLSAVQSDAFEVFKKTVND